MNADILMVDDEPRRVQRWIEVLQKNWTVLFCASSDDGMTAIRQPEFLKTLRLVVLDLDMYTPRGISDRRTDLGRITGVVLAEELRKFGWDGPIVVLTNSNDANLEAFVKGRGDHFVRKPKVFGEAFAELVRGILDD
ncbi:MAG: response regulator [Planctomycetota bacterium]